MSVVWLDLLVLQELKRKITQFEDLSYTYFTVENIETKYDILYRNGNNK